MNENAQPPQGAPLMIGVPQMLNLHDLLWALRQWIRVYPWTNSPPTEKDVEKIEQYIERVVQSLSTPPDGQSDGSL